MSTPWPDPAGIVSSAVCVFLISSVIDLSPFLPFFSRDTKSEWGTLARLWASFLRASKETLIFSLFLGGTTNLEVARQLTDKP
jgi:hypothetical protein